MSTGDKPDSIQQSTERKNQHLRAIIQRTKIDTSYSYRSDQLIDEKIKFLAEHCQKVLDFGKSSRHRFECFASDQIVTCDINQFDGYPDIIDDICEIKNLQESSFDGIVCMAVLEHVYAPQDAVNNMYKLLKNEGYCLAYTPFLYNYHAPGNLKYQDYFRYTKDGLAYLFRDFSDVTLYPVRARISTICNLLPGWKYRIEKIFGQRINKMLDHFFGGIKVRDHPVAHRTDCLD